MELAPKNKIKPIIMDNKLSPSSSPFFFIRPAPLIMRPRPIIAIIPKM